MLVEDLCPLRLQPVHPYFFPDLPTAPSTYLVAKAAASILGWTYSSIWFDGRSVAVDYTVPNTLNLKQRTPGLKYAPLDVQKAAQNLKISKYANLARIKNHKFVPLVAESLGGLGGMAVKLFGDIARAQASSRHPVGHILRCL